MSALIIGNAAAQTATQVATQAATQVATQVATQAATQVATQVATQAATQIATQVATQAVTQVATQVATQAVAQIAVQAVTQVAVSLAVSYYQTALTYEGVPYKFGGMSRSGVDCSGLVNLSTGHETRVWSTSGGTPPGNWSKLNLNTKTLANLTSGLNGGDLLVFPGHTAFYAGGDVLFHAQRTGTNVGYTGGSYKGAGLSWWYKNKGILAGYRQVQ